MKTLLLLLLSVTMYGQTYTFDKIEVNFGDDTQPMWLAQPIVGYVIKTDYQITTVTSISHNINNITATLTYASKRMTIYTTTQDNVKTTIVWDWSDTTGNKVVVTTIDKNQYERVTLIKANHPCYGTK